MNAPSPGSEGIDDPAGYRLHYSSDLSREEFERRCRRQPFWYHSYYFDNGFEVRGDYNIGPDIASYGFPDDLAGATVLDIGTGAGWFAHYFHQRGAVVTAVDVRGPMDYDAFGVFERPGGMGARPPDRLDADGQPIYFSPSSGAFWLMRDLLGADIGFKNARATDVCPDLFGGQRFDLVFLGALLCHVRDPIGALMAARSVCAGQVVASTLVDVWDTSSDAAARLMWTQPSAVGWWFPNLACYREWFLAAGFRDPDVSRQVSLRADRPRESVSRTQLHVAGHAFV